jgi:hypothetical protein
MKIKEEDFLMDLQKAIKKIEKRLGVKLDDNGDGRYYVQVGDYVGSFLTQKKWRGEEGEREASNWHIRHHADHTDSMSDYFAGSYRDNCTQWLNSLSPLEPKFPVGCLVRGKDNKRAIRQGYAGKVGLVTGSGTYMKVDWLGEEPPSYSMTYPERDLELIS